MFIEKYNYKNNMYYRLVENIKYVSKNDGKTRYQKKLILSLGNANKYPFSFEEIRNNFKNGIAIIPELEPYISTEDFRVNITLNKNDNIEIKNVGYLILNNIFNELKIDQVFTLEKSRKNLGYDALGLAKILVFDRVLKPSSKVKTFENKDIFLSNITTTKDFRKIYEVLDIFNIRKNKIINTINKNIESKIGRKHDFYYYDVTNYYFETDKKDDDVFDEEGNVISKGLRKPGVSKERRKEPIIQMGMFLDSNSIPISYEMFSGNTLDKQTLSPTLNDKSLDIKGKKILIVGDRGMVNVGNELEIINSGNDYLFARGVRQSNKEIKNWVLDNDGYISKSESFKYKSSIIERKVLDKKTNTMVSIKEKVLSFWSRKYYEKEKKEKETFIETLNKYIENPNSIPAGQKKGLDKYIIVEQVNPKTGEIIKTKELKRINMKKIEEESKYLGYYLINSSDKTINDLEMIRIYKGLTQIENCFRITKSELKARPVYCRKPEHIKGHFLVCYIALTIMRILQNKVSRYINKKDVNVWNEGISSSKLQSILKEFNTSIIKGWCLFEDKKEDKQLITLLNALGIDFKFNILKENEIKEKLKFAL